jgi:hypothetical protein
VLFFLQRKCLGGAEIKFIDFNREEKDKKRQRKNQKVLFALSRSLESILQKLKKPSR